MLDGINKLPNIMTSSISHGSGAVGQTAEEEEQLMRRVEEAQGDVEKMKTLFREREQIWRSVTRPAGRDGDDSLASGLAEKSHEKERTPLSRLKNVEKIGSFDGDPEKWEQWKDKLQSFLDDEPGLGEVLKRVAKMEVEITEIQIGFMPKGVMMLSPQIYSKQLSTLLKMLTTGVAWDIVSNSDGNGFRAWQRLHLELASTTPQKKRALLKKVLQPERATTMEELTAKQEKWETALIKYKDVLRDNETQLSDDVLVCSYVALLPQEIQEKIDALSVDLLDLSAVKKYVRKQIS